MFPWSEAGASQGEKGKKRRKDTLTGVFALVIRWYYYNKKRAFVKRVRQNPEPYGARRRHMGQRAALRRADMAAPARRSVLSGKLTALLQIDSSPFRRFVL
jgi:hypothetical protein